MNKKWLAACTLFASVFAANASAGEWLIGVKAGLVDYDLPGSDAGVGAAFMLGKEMWDLGAADIAIEGEIVQSIVDPEINNIERGFESVAAYASLRTAGPVYAIARAGIAKAEVGTTDDTGRSLGLGVGFSAGGLRWEVEYTTYEIENTDVDFITLGLSF